MTTATGVSSRAAVANASCTSRAAVAGSARMTGTSAAAKSVSYDTACTRANGSSGVRMPEESPVSRTIGEFALRAVMSGVTVFVSPGPWVTMQTPTRPVARANPSAAATAPASWRAA